jgi:murein L,D-transpeptidase YcbB/YkuD
MLPKLRRNGGFLANQGIRLYASWQPGAAQLDGTAIDWSTVGAGHIAGLRMRQEPGPTNPLGRVKFNLPNGFDVYLHDTNHKNFFAQNMRALSSGCVRVQDALGLADVLLRDDPRWTPEKRKALTADWTTRTVSLASPVPVYLVYETVWRDGTGRVQVRQDIYGRDASLAKAVAETARRGRPLAST